MLIIKHNNTKACVYDIISDVKEELSTDWLGDIQHALSTLKITKKYIYFADVDQKQTISNITMT